MPTLRNTRRRGSSVWAFLLVLWASLAADVRAIKLGFSLPLSNDLDKRWVHDVWTAVSYRLDQLKQSIPNLHPEVLNLTLIPKDTRNTTRTHAIRAGIDLMAEGVVGVIGQGYSDMTQALAATAGPYNLPVCDGAATAAVLSNKTEFPSFFRTVAPDYGQAFALLDFIKAQNWKQFAVIASQDDYGQSIWSTLKRLSDQMSIKYLTVQNFYPHHEDWNALVSNLRETDATIFVYLGQPGDFRQLLSVARSQGLWGEGYAWLTTDAIQSLHLSQYDETELELLDGVINIFPIEGSGVQYDRFLADWRNVVQAPPNSTVLPGAFTTFYMGCLEMMFRGYDRLLKSLPPTSPAYLTLTNPTPFKNLTSIIDTVKDFSFPEVDSPTGMLGLNENGDRISGYQYLFYNRSLNDWQPFGTWIENRLSWEGGVAFSGGTSKRPPDSVYANLEPNSIEFPSVSAILIYISSTLSLVLITLSAIGILVFRHDPVIKAASPSFCLLILSGLLIASCYPPIVMLNAMTDWKCVAEIWMVPGAFGIVLGNLLSKIYRVFRIFQNTLNSRSRLRAVRDKDVFLWSSIIILGELVISLLWTLLSPPTATMLRKKHPNTSKLELDPVCTSPHATTFIALSYGYNGFLLILGMLLAIGTRHLP
ncbi:hypothetical protein HK102_006875, partial [Quaeritorhiza haematococci]